MPRGWSASAGAEADVAVENRAVEGRRLSTPSGHFRPDCRRRVHGRRRDVVMPASRHRRAAAGRSGTRAPDRGQRPQHLRDALLGVTSPNAAKVTAITPQLRHVTLPGSQRLGFFGVETWELGVAPLASRSGEPWRITWTSSPGQPPGAQLASAGKWTATARAAASGTAVSGQIGAPGLPRPARIHSATPGGVSGWPKRSSARRSSARPRAISAVRPRLVQLRVVQHDQAGIAGEVGPHVVVAAGVAELVDDQIEGLRLMDAARSRTPTDGAPGRSDRGKPVRARRASDRRAAQTSSPTKSAMSWRAARAGSTIVL